MLGAPRSHRGRNTIVFIAVICLLVLGVIYVLGMGDGGEGNEPITKPSALGIDSTSPKPSAKPTISPSKSATPATGVVRVSAADGDCWLEVRVGSSTGRVLYSDTMNQGVTKVFRGKTLWLRLGNPPALLINVDGTKMPRITETGPLDYLAKDGKLTRQG